MAQFKHYLVSYNYEGSRWNIEVPAASFDDAEARVRALSFAKVDGELFAKIPASVGFLAPLMAWLGNTFRREGAAGG